MIHYKTQDDLELMKESSLLASKTLAEVGQYIKPGITPLELDVIAEKFILSQNALPAFKGYNDFPNTLCISVNEAVVHGIPSDKKLKNGDIVSVDCGVEKNGFFGDVAFTFEVGEVEEEVRNLLKTTRLSLEKGIEKVIEGNRMGDVSHAIQEQAESNGYTVVRELVGHGLGKSLHEAPEVPNYGRRGRGIKLKEGMVLSIEPMINLGTRKITTEKDDWTIITLDRKPSAHYEHNVAVGKHEAILLSNFEFIDQVIK